MDISEVFVNPSLSPLYFMYLFSENGDITYTKGTNPEKPYKNTILTVDVDPSRFAMETSLEDYMQDIVRMAFITTTEAAIQHKSLDIESGDIIVLVGSIEPDEIQKLVIKFQDIYDVINQPMSFKFKLKVLDGEIMAFEVGCFNDPTEIVHDFTL